ncbi:MAG: hypothetical protein IVW54_18195 [Candidatus Binataceae bacterium]|nr:hypothetical protein [Candidatus Binataceae bacterium]
MKTYTRIYSDAKGETHFEDVTLKLGDSHIGKISELLAAKGVQFRHAADYFIDWHNAPRRQFVIHLAGEMEIVVSDGEKRHFGPGAIVLAEDLTGKGHTTRSLGSEERITVYVPLAD